MRLIAYTIEQTTGNKLQGSLIHVGTDGVLLDKEVNL